MTRKGGENADDVHGEWIRAARFAREGGLRVYVDAWTLREALEAAGIPTDTPVEDLEILRKTMAHGCRPGCRKDHEHKFSRGRAEVLLVIRQRRTPRPHAPDWAQGLRPEDREAFLRRRPSEEVPPP